MSDQQDKQEIEDVDLVSAQLTRGLETCHSIVDDYRSKLVTNSNDPDTSAADDDSLRG